MRRICRIVIITLGYVAGLAGATMASAFSCSGGSFLSTVGTPNSDLSGFTGPYGEVCVTLIDSTHALVQAGRSRSRFSTPTASKKIQPTVVSPGIVCWRGG